MLTLSIQSGGRSTRMGQDKGLLPFLGEPLVKRVVSRVAHTADEIIITTNNPSAYSFLEVPLFPDILPGLGALSGLYTSLVNANHPVVALVACDLPFANAALLLVCRDILLDTKADAVVPATEHGLEPLHAVYRKDSCLPLVEKALKKGKRRMVGWHEDATIHVLHPDLVAKYDPFGVTFWNVNTPEEFHKAEAKAKELAQGKPKLS